MGAMQTLKSVVLYASWAPSIVVFLVRQRSTRFWSRQCPSPQRAEGVKAAVGTPQGLGLDRLSTRRDGDPTHASC